MSDRLTVFTFLSLAAAGDPEANELVAPLVGWEHVTAGDCPGWERVETREYLDGSSERVRVNREEPPPYATAGPADPERWALWGEMLEAYQRAEGLPSWLVALEWWIGDAHSIWISDLERQLPTPNAALAAALGLALDQLTED